MHFVKFTQFTKPKKKKNRWWCDSLSELIILSLSGCAGVMCLLLAQMSTGPETLVRYGICSRRAHKYIMVYFCKM